MAIKFLNSGVFSGNVAGTILIAQKTSIPSGNGAFIGRLSFNAYNVGTTYSTGANITAVASSAWTSTSTGTHLQFSTTSDTSVNPVNRMYIASNGYVGIDAADPGAKLHVNQFGASGNQTVVATLGSTSLRPVLQFSENHTNASITSGMSIEYNGVGSGDANYMAINSVTGAARLIITSGGSMQLPTYGAGTLITDASGNITVSSGGGAGGPYLPLAGGTMSGNLTISIPDGGSAPAMTNTLFMKGYEGRGIGMKLRDSANSATGASNREWFVGSGYSNSGFNIGYSATGSSSSYSAQSKFNITTGGVVTIPGNVGIGTTAPDSNLSISTGNVNSRLDFSDERGYVGYNTTYGPSGGIYIDGGGLSNKVLILNPVSSGNVGIGTTSPSATLEVKTGASAGAVRLSSDGNGAIFSANGHLQFYTNNTVYATKFYSANKASTLATILDNGNVGIGTTSPNKLLDVSSDNTPTIRITNTLQSSSNYTAGAFEFYSEDASTPGGARVLSSILCVNNAGSSVPNGNLAFYTALGGGSGAAATEKMRIDYSGNVGIGTDSPDFKLDVAGDVRIENNSGLYFGGDTSTSFKWGIASVGLDLVINNSTTNGDVTFINDGNVGIGTTSPGEKLEVAGNVILDSANARLKIKGGVTGTNGGIDFTFNTDSTSYAKMELDYDTRASTGLLIDSGYPMTLDYSSGSFSIKKNGSSELTILNGNVGIGTTSPLYKLQVQDRIHIEDTTSQQPKISFSENTNASGEFVLEYNGAGGGAGNYVAFYSEVSGWASKGNGLNYIPSLGYVGIGTASPDGNLEISDSTQATGATLSITNAHNGSWVTGDKVGSIDFRINDPSTTQSVRARIHAEGKTTGTYPSSSQLVFSTASANTLSESMRIDSAGNVGIGTTDPLGKLMVRDDTAGTPTRLIVSNGGTAQSGTSARLSFYEGASEKGYIERRRDGSGKIAFVTPADNNPFVWENPTGEIMRINNSNVGIGTTSPSYKLDVTGNGRFTSTVTATNFILSSDKRLKDNIKEIDTNHVDVNWKNFELKSEPGVKRSGVIAQELEEKHPEFVRTDDEGMKSVAYIDLLIAKIAELEARLEKLEK